MLVRLMYASRAAENLGPDELQVILHQCKAHNPEEGITGLLCLHQPSRLFMQVLEGGRSAVNRLYRRLVTDARHSDIELLSYEEITERRFATWSMGQIDVARLNPALVIKYSTTARLDPFALPGRVSMALFDELAATASIMSERS
jgi:hypothetical protein